MERSKPSIKDIADENHKLVERMTATQKLGRPATVLRNAGLMGPFEDARR